MIGLGKHQCWYRLSHERRRIHLLRIAWVAYLLARNGVIVLCSAVLTPHIGMFVERLGKIIEESSPFMELHVKCSLEECITCEPKGLYKRAYVEE